MPNKLTIILSGRKQAGKNTACNHILAKFYNHQSLTRSQEPMWTVDANTGELCFNLKPVNHSSDLPNDDAKIYSFADPLKRFCIDVLGAPEEACYGTDAQKNTPIPHLMWENLPIYVRWLNGTREFMGITTGDIFKPDDIEPIKSEGDFWGIIQEHGFSYRGEKCGPMTGREIMQIIGTEICRKLYGDCWAAGTYNSIRREGFTLALVSDGRFPNEIRMGTTVKAKTIRLGRHIFQDQHASETSLDNFPNEDYSLYINNQNMTISEQLAVVEENVEVWFQEAGIYA